MNNSYLAIGSSLPKLYNLFRKNGFRLHPKYILRLLLLLQSAIWSSVFGMVERKRMQKSLRKQALPEKPVFIIGHWRTGSTLLHQLMCLDEQFVSPSVFQVTVPDCFVSIEKYYKPFMGKMMGKKRPMDNVKFGPDAPQEDEFALFRMTQQSPLQKLVFPDGKGYFLMEDAVFSQANPPSAKWEKALLRFYKKLVNVSGKRLLIKNPFHSMRITSLRQLFPDACFIHIYRNPLDVVPSTINMWDIIARQNCLKKGWRKPEVAEVSRLYHMMLQHIDAGLMDMEEARSTAVKFEALEQDPVGEMKRVYAHLGLTWSARFEEAILAFLERERNYRKNVFHVPEADRATISKEMEGFMRAHGYG